MLESLGKFNLTPISAFRDPKIASDARLPVARIFRSSGTTSDSRAYGPFSLVGEARYREAALAHFDRILRASGLPLSSPGLSLIPSTEVWPESSLAQMLSWIAEEHPVTFTSIDDLPSAFNSPGQPFWLFLTGFHLREIADKGLSVHHKNLGLVVETGGFKNQATPMNRSAYMDLLCQVLGVFPHQVVSEYGMSELSAQAYDMGLPGQRFEERWFQFDDSVRTQVLTPNGKLEPFGFGQLVVEDPNRIDYPEPILTEDVVLLTPKGFQLKGRRPKTVVRGCSLNTNYRPKPTLVKRVSHQKSTQVGQACSRLREFLDSPDAYLALEAEFGNAQVVAWALEDLVESLKQEALVDLPQRVSSDRSWLLIGPSSHSIAYVYPLLVATLAGIDVTVRAHPFPFLQALQHVFSCHWTDPLDVDKISHPFEAVLIYGSDPTIAWFNATYPTQGFGHKVCANRVGKSFRDFDNLIRDMFSLQGRGCLSSRAVAYLGDDPEGFRTNLRSAYQRLLAPTQSPWQPTPEFPIIGSWTDLGEQPAIVTCRSIPEGIDFTEEADTGQMQSYLWDGSYQGETLFSL